MDSVQVLLGLQVGAEASAPLLQEASQCNWWQEGGEPRCYLSKTALTAPCACLAGQMVPCPGPREDV